MRVGHANFWLIFHRLEDRADGCNAASPQVFLLLRLRGGCFEDLAKSGHEGRVVARKEATEARCKRAQKDKGFLLQGLVLLVNRELKENADGLN